LINLRGFYTPPGGEAIPTKKRLTLSVELRPELTEAVLKLEEAMELTS